MNTVKRYAIQALLWLALVLALVGSLRHVAWSFSTLEQGDLAAGYVQAVAVDIGLLALALGIQTRRRQERGTWTLWAGVFLFSAVSTYANLLHGLVFQSDIGLDGWAGLVFARPFILSAVLPALVIYLSEIAAADWQHAAAELEKEQRKAEQDRKRSERQTVKEPFGDQSFPMPIERLQAVRQANKAAALDALAVYLDGNPDASLNDAGRAIGRSKTTVSNYLAELEEAGRITRNGAGVKVNGG